MNLPYHVIGIDPSLNETGLVRFRKEGFGKLIPEFGTCLKLKAEHGDRRLFKIRTEVVSILTCVDDGGRFLEPGIVGIEENVVYSGKSVRTALKQREVIGVCIEAAISLGWEVHRISPTEAKSCLGGKGDGQSES